MKVEKTKIEGAVIIKPDVYKDDRGFFLETYNEQKYEDIIGRQTFVQDNMSKSNLGVLRGMHFQTNNPQGKLVRCVSGEVLDFAVDLRKDSPTYGAWDGVVLRARHHTQFWLPPGLAHGFIVLSMDAIFEYKCTTPYDPSSEQSLRWDDPDIGIDWGFDMIFDEGFKPILSTKDAMAKSFQQLRSEGVC